MIYGQTSMAISRSVGIHLPEIERGLQGLRHVWKILQIGCVVFPECVHCPDRLDHRGYPEVLLVKVFANRRWSMARRVMREEVAGPIG